MVQRGAKHSVSPVGTRRLYFSFFNYWTPHPPILHDASFHLLHELFREVRSHNPSAMASPRDAMQISGHDTGGYVPGSLWHLGGDCTTTIIHHCRPQLFYASDILFAIVYTHRYQPFFHIFCPWSCSASALLPSHLAQGRGSVCTEPVSGYCIKTGNAEEAVVWWMACVGGVVDGVCGWEGESVCVAEGY